MASERPPLPGGELAGVVGENIRSLGDLRRTYEGRRTRSDRIADGVTRFAGSMWCVYAHLLVFGGWLAINGGLVPLPKWDPYPFTMLAMAASVEAIFLSTFILVSQNRQAALAEQRAELDLQVNLLAEHEITRLLHVVERIAQRVGAPLHDQDLGELKKDVDPQAVVREIERSQDGPPA